MYSLCFLAIVVQHLELPPRVDTTSQFYNLEQTKNPILMALEQTNEKIVQPKIVRNVRMGPGADENVETCINGQMTFITKGFTT